MLPQYYEDEDHEITIVGVDEAGRGPLAGPVTAAAVIWDASYQPTNKEDEKLMSLVKDSKKLSEKRRIEVAEFIKKNATAYAVADVDNHEIDETNILKANFKAMHSALKNLSTKFDKIYVDGNMFRPYFGGEDTCIPHTCIVNGDNTLFQIAAASILAKTHRDEIMKKYHQDNEECRVYNWAKNKGYGTKEHMDAIRQYGISSFHRKTFLKKLI
jgi:ribonuclease HII